MFHIDFQDFLYASYCTYGFSRLSLGFIEIVGRQRSGLQGDSVPLRTDTADSQDTSKPPRTRDRGAHVERNVERNTVVVPLDASRNARVGRVGIGNQERSGPTWRSLRKWRAHQLRITTHAQLPVSGPVTGHTLEPASRDTCRTVACSGWE